MIVGNGLIAKSFMNEDHADITLFASGVSNSLETNPYEFKREEELLIANLKHSDNKLFIYISTCSVYDPSKQGSAYVKHKLAMESIVESMANKYLIFRASNVVGHGGNPNLLMNYLYNRLHSGEIITVFEYAQRNFIDIKDMVKIVMHSLRSGKSNSIINVAYKSNFSSVEIIEEFENIFNKKFNKIFENRGTGYSIEVDDYDCIFDKSVSKNEYLSLMIKNYYK